MKCEKVQKRYFLYYVFSVIGLLGLLDLFYNTEKQSNEDKYDVHKGNTENKTTKLKQRMPVGIQERCVRK